MVDIDDRGFSDWVDGAASSAGPGERIDEQTLAWPVIAVLLGLAYGLALFRWAPELTGVFLEGVLLVETVVLTVVVALIAVLLQRDNRSITTLQRISGKQGRVLAVEFVGGVVFGVGAIGLSLWMVSSTVRLDAGVVLAVVIQLFASVSLLLTSLLGLLRRLRPESLATALLVALGRAAGDKAEFDRLLVEVEAFVARLARDGDVTAFRSFARGLATVERDRVPASSAALTALRSRLLRQLSSQPEFAATLIRESRLTVDQILDTIMEPAASVEIMVVSALFKKSQELKPEEAGRFWRQAVCMLLSTEVLKCWDDSLLDDFISSFDTPKVPSREYRAVIDSIIACPEASPLRMQSLLESVQGVGRQFADSEAALGIRRATSRLAPRVLRWHLETAERHERIEEFGDTVRAHIDLAALIAADLPYVRRDVIREVTSMAPGGRGLFSMLVLARVEAADSEESRSLLSTELRPALLGLDAATLGDALEHVLRHGGDSPAVISHRLHGHAEPVGLAGLVASRHIRWCIQTGDAEFGPRAAGGLAHVYRWATRRGSPEGSPPGDADLPVPGLSDVVVDDVKQSLSGLARALASPHSLPLAATRRQLDFLGALTALSLALRLEHSPTTSPIVKSLEEFGSVIDDYQRVSRHPVAFSESARTAIASHLGGVPLSDGPAHSDGELIRRASGALRSIEVTR